MNFDIFNFLGNAESRKLKSVEFINDVSNLRPLSVVQVSTSSGILNLTATVVFDTSLDCYNGDFVTVKQLANDKGGVFHSATAEPQIDYYLVALFVF